MIMARLKRARQDWQKEARERDILDAAAQLFVASGRLPAMAEVAEQAGLAKGTLYLYFQGREALWLQLLNGCFERWVDAISEGLSHIETVTNEDVARITIETAATQPMLIPLSVSNATLIEPKATPDQTARFKTATAELIAKLGRYLAGRLDLTHDDATSRVLLTYALLLGLWQMTTAVPVPGSKLPAHQSTDFWSMDWQREAHFGLRNIWTVRTHQ
jgi:AcrR family transcriptional regulator